MNNPDCGPAVTIQVKRETQRRDLLLHAGRMLAERWRVHCDLERDSLQSIEIGAPG